MLVFTELTHLLSYASLIFIITIMTLALSTKKGQNIISEMFIKNNVGLFPTKMPEHCIRHDKCLYHDKPLIFIGATFREKLVSHHQVMNETEPVAIYDTIYWMEVEL